MATDGKDQLESVMVEVADEAEYSSHKQQSLERLPPQFPSGDGSPIFSTLRQRLCHPVFPLP